ncbi:MAG: xanthine dehydrogenase family protein subunit M [Deltaproteobacteria bacterium]|nr:xanthine dehydrogenase family protein subunit M [Deltaproteobacteria bacterium]
MEPKSLRRASQLLKQHGGEAKLIAGGVSLIAMMKNRLVRPAVLVNIKAIPGLDKLSFQERKGLRFGPLVIHRRIATEPLIRERFTLLAEAASEIGSPAIRNMGTVGGNLCHADPNGDLAPALLCLNARLKLVSAAGKRDLSVDEFCADYYTTSLEPDEILAEIAVPLPPRGSGGAYLKFKRTATDMAVVQVAACVRRDASSGCTAARVVLGSAGPFPILAKEAATFLEGKDFSPEIIEQSASMAAAEAQPMTDGRGSEEYKREMARVCVQRALKVAWKRAGGSD